MATSVIRLVCPNLRCRSILAVPGSARGKMVRCRKCGSRVQVPAPKNAPQSEQTAPAEEGQPAN